MDDIGNCCSRKILPPKLEERSFVSIAKLLELDINQAVEEGTSGESAGEHPQ